MTQVAAVYGGALYALVRDEGLSQQLQQELKFLQTAFKQEPDFLRLLSCANLTKPQRCRILEESFQKHLHPYMVSFLKLLTRRGHIRHFSDCCECFHRHYNEDNGILPVTAVTAVPLQAAQQNQLVSRLTQLTGKTVKLILRVDPRCLAGVRLEFDGQQLDGTLRYRLDAIRRTLKSTVL